MVEQYSIKKHIANWWIEIECPLKYSVPEMPKNCTQEKCAWFMIHQRACAINVLARKSQ